MNVNATAWIYESVQCHILTSIEKSVLLNLAYRSKKDKLTSFPSIESIVQDTSISRRAIVYTLKSLVKKGMLAIKKQANKVSNYTLLTPNKWVTKAKERVSRVLSSYTVSAPHAPQKQEDNAKTVYRHSARGAHVIEHIINKDINISNKENKKKKLFVLNKHYRLSILKKEGLLMINTDGRKVSLKTREKDPTKIVSSLQHRSIDPLNQFINKKTTISNMSNFWQISLNYYQKEDYPLLPLTTKERNQLSAIKKRVGDIPIYPLLNRVLSKWGSFTKHCEYVHSAFKSPMFPSVSYVLRYLQGAVSFYTEGLDTVKVINPVKKVVQPVIVEEEEEVKEAFDINSFRAFEERLKNGANT